MNKAVIIFSGYNDRAITTFLRTLESNKVNYGIIAKSVEDEIFFTDYKNKVQATRSKKALDFEDLSNCIKTVQQRLSADKYVIAPSTEALNRYLLDNQINFEELGCEVPLVDKVLYEKISDKDSFNKLCNQEGILSPISSDKLADISFPLVAKPKSYFSSKREVFIPIIISNQADYNLFAKEYKAEDFFYQEYVNGKSYYLLYYFYKDSNIVKFSQINYLQQPDGKSMIAAEATDFHNNEESLKYEQLLKSIGFFGLIMVEVKNYEGKNYMIEANPRFWGPSQLFVDSGVNLFNDFLYDHGLINQKPSHQESSTKAKYFWLGGIAETIANGQKLTYHTYSPLDFSVNLGEWIKADIYNRDDTRQFFIVQNGLSI